MNTQHITKREITVFSILLVVAGLTLWWQLRNETSTTTTAITTFQECVDAGYPVAESFPRQCRTPEGKMFVEPKSEVNENTNKGATNSSTNASTNSATNTSTATRSASHYGVHTGSLSFAASQTYVNELGSQLWVRDGGGLYRDEYGWGKRGYSEPASRTPLPSVSSTRFLSFEANRYDDTEPARPISTYPSGHEQNYRSYLNYLLDAYAGKLQYWEVNNEVDLAQFWSGSATDYANLVKLASGIIKPRCANCDVGVSFSSSTIGNQQFYSALGGVCSSFDFFDIHAVSGLLVQPTDLDQWKRTCPNKEFISTESGVSDAPSGKSSAKVQIGGGSAALQARDLAKYNTLLFAAGYNKIFWYLIDTDYGSLDIFLHNALIDESGSKKPAFTAYKTMIDKTDYFTSVTKLGEGQYKYSFADKDPVYVLWCDAGSCSLPSAISGQVTVTDHMGVTTTQSASSIRLTASPIFVE